MLKVSKALQKTPQELRKETPRKEGTRQEEISWQEIQSLPQEMQEILRKKGQKGLQKVFEEMSQAFEKGIAKKTRQEGIQSPNTSRIRL